MTAKTTPRKAAQLTKKRRGGSRTLSSSHKDALIQGRRMSATVDRYLRALHTPKRRGRKVSKTRLGERLVSAQMRAKSGTGVDRVVASQEARGAQRPAGHVAHVGEPRYRDPRGRVRERGEAVQREPGYSIRGLARSRRPVGGADPSGDRSNPRLSVTARKARWCGRAPAAGRGRLLGLGSGRRGDRAVPPS